jgi:hypothetical protein
MTSSKLQSLSLYSDYAKVQEIARRHNIDVQPSSRSDKKYMTRSPEGRLIHFGQMGMEDYTRHQDKKRRDAFRNRMRRFKDAPKYTAGWLSLNLLWD